MGEGIRFTSLMTEPIVPTPDDDARTLGVIGLLVTLFVPLAGALICIQSLYASDGANGPNRAAIAGLPVALAVAAFQIAALAWFVGLLR